jgi:fructosamine-3-kinase
MSTSASDISWQTLRRIVHRWVGESAELAEVHALDGGNISTTLELVTKAGDKAVLKISPHRVDRDVLREAMQLQVLKERGMPVPTVYQWNVASLDDPDSYLLMEFMSGVNLFVARERCTPEQYDDLQRHLAELMLALHSHTAETYSRVASEGASQFEEWPAFYRHVYDTIWHDVERSNGLPVKCRKQISRIHERLERLIAHDDEPRLVHWDIWSANVLAAPDSEGRWRVTGLLDPNCKYAHAEAELAYMEFYHTATPAFMKAYQQSRKLPAGYHQVRKHIYQLYDLLNHVHLFGNEYVKPLLQVVEKTTAIV